MTKFNLFIKSNIKKNINTSCIPYLSFNSFLFSLSSYFYLVANSTPIVLLLSRLNSLRVKRDNKFDLPTPESPINTTKQLENN